MSNAVLGLRLKQQLTLTPRLQQSVKLLQLSALECVQELNQAMALNPFLEEPADDAEATSTEVTAEESTEAGSTEQHGELDFSTASGSSHSSSDETPN